jgi:PIN domain nuclease of toxin-antitoxin system
MKALLDTHSFLWWNTNDPKLSSNALKIIEDGNNEIYFSSVSAWEVTLKAAKGSLILPEPPDKFVSNSIHEHNFTALPVHISHALHVFHLPFHHSDPFDRLLIAQSILENLPIITLDKNIKEYEITTIW